jgi:hypothetical protein
MKLDEVITNTSLSPAIEREREEGMEKRQMSKWQKGVTAIGYGPAPSPNCSDTPLTYKHITIGGILIDARGGTCSGASFLFFRLATFF